MPYGISKKLGGDTPRSDKWMEKCVADVTSKGTPKINAIMICKAQYQKSHGSQEG